MEVILQSGGKTRFPQRHQIVVVLDDYGAVFSS